MPTERFMLRTVSYFHIKITLDTIADKKDYLKFENLTKAYKLQRYYDSATGLPYHCLIIVKFIILQLKKEVLFVMLS